MRGDNYLCLHNTLDSLGNERKEVQEKVQQMHKLGIDFLDWAVEKDYFKATLVPFTEHAFIFKPTVDLYVEYYKIFVERHMGVMGTLFC